MPQLQRTDPELREMPERQRAAGAGVFEDLFTSFFGGPGKPGAAMGLGIPGAPMAQLPGAVSSGFRGLGPVLGAGGTGLTGGKAAMMGDPISALLGRIQGMARRMNPKQAEDLAQTGAEAVTRGMQTTSMGGREASRTARNAMLMEMRKGVDVGRQSDVSAIKNALARKGERAGEYSLWTEVRKSHPNMTLDRFRHLRAGVGMKRQVSLEAPIRQGESKTFGELLRGTDDPSEVAMLKERFGKLTESQQGHLDDYLAGKPVHRQILDRILKKLEVRQKGAKPISGGAGDQFTNPEHPAFTAHSLYNVRQSPGPDPVTGEVLPSISPRGFMEISDDMKLGPGSEVFYGQGTPAPSYGGYTPALRTKIVQGPTQADNPALMDQGTGQRFGPAGRGAAMAHPDTMRPGPYPKQSLAGFQQLQRMIMDALLNTGRN